VWGDTVGTNTVAQNITLANNTSGSLTFTIFTRINALQDVRAGTYNDSLTVTVTF
jgi:spore coat protein U-like protein